MRDHITPCFTAVIPFVLLGCSNFPASIGKLTDTDGSAGAKSCQRSHICDIVNLDEGRYTAEIFHHAESNEIAIYTFTADCSRVASIRANELVLTFSNRKSIEKVSFLASPQDKDPAGTSSKFVLCSSSSWCDELVSHPADLQIMSIPMSDSNTGNIATGGQPNRN